MLALENREKRILALLRESGGIPLGVQDLLNQTGWSDQAHVVGAAMGLVEKEYASMEEDMSSRVRLGPEGIMALQVGLLEKRLMDWLTSVEPDQRTMAALSAAFDKSESGPGVGLLRGLGAVIESGVLVLSDQNHAEEETQHRTEFIESLADSPLLVTDSNKDTVAHFSNRRGLIEVENSTTRSWKASQAGLDLNPQDLVESEQIGELTPDILQGDSWREMEFKPFDIHAPAPIPLGGRPHPLQSLIDRIRAVFLEMGFSEITGNYVQSAGWNMDALFIPQDHPARTMQDTFYLAEPEIVGIDDKHLRQWAEVHESGGSTVSRGWGGSFDVNESRKALLRTHTTVNTVRHIADHPSKPSRVFGVGRVFRQETIDRTHLPEFHQIEGIIHEEKASLPMLITTLRTFYSKMGYSDVRVRPAYFPYTEPSIEVEILWRGKWLELGGAGIFRPEVTQPLGTGWPVCAWGMGLERLAMLILGLDDIRELYQPDLEVLSKMPLL
ncbi:MAG: phenylalanine--tRNA ligase subunit alpha [Euryarchaeota archaeon]|jgi:phenylalanyl-tRNA synthetase alpha chain|nr:phenylalanine--tRNA ligase subunit alpha [Euryarchaeota archaeon]